MRKKSDLPKGDMSTLGGRIFHLRKQHDIGQKQFADYLHVSVSTVSNYENNVHQPDIPTLIKIADYFDVSVDYLLNRTQFSFPISFLENHKIDRYSIATFFTSALQLSETSQADLLKYLHLLEAHDQKKNTKI